MNRKNDDYIIVLRKWVKKLGQLVNSEQARRLCILFFLLTGFYHKYYCETDCCSVAYVCFIGSIILHYLQKKE